MAAAEGNRDTGETSDQQHGEKTFALHYQKGDLFSCPETESLVHCVSEDLRMGKGIATLFKDKFGGVSELKLQAKKVGDVAVLKRGRRHVYYMITKPKYFHKPTYSSLEESLVALRDHCVQNGVIRLSMPKIGCGLDKLEWTQVENKLNEVFSKTDIVLEEALFEINLTSIPYSMDHTYSIHSGETCANEPSPVVMKRFDEIICEFMRDQGIPGAAVCISLHGKIIYKQGYGVSQTGERMSSSAHFRVASISKILTAVGIMRLCEQGTCSLDQTLFGSDGILSDATVPITHESDMGKITVRDALQHSGGWDRESSDGDHVFWYQQTDHAPFIDPWDNWSFVTHVLKYPLRFQPGSKHVYSNFGYLLLGLVIERLTCMRYEDYIKDILREIDIENIQVGHAKQDLVDFREVKYYNNREPIIDQSVFEGEGLVPTQYGGFTMENTGAYGGWVTCADHLVIFLDNLVDTLNNSKDNGSCPSQSCILTGHSIAQMLAKPSYHGDGEEAWYGLGLDVQDNGRSFGHTGSMDGTSTTVHHHTSGLTWSLLLNACSRDTDLDGVIKLAFMSVPSLPLWYTGIHSIADTDHIVISQDGHQCITYLMSHDQLKSHVTMMMNVGYKISHLNVLTVHNNVLVTIVWDRNTAKKQYGLIMDVELDKFCKYLQRMGFKCMRITFLEPYKHHGKVLYMCVYEVGVCCSSQKIYSISGPQDKCEQRHRDNVTMCSTEGYELVSQSILPGGSTLVTLTAVFEKVGPSCAPVDQSLWMSVPVEEFEAQLAQHTRLKQKLDYLQFYTCHDKVRVAAVWSQCRLRTHRKYTNNTKRQLDVGPMSKRCSKPTSSRHCVLAGEYTSCRHKSCGKNVYQRHNVSKYGFLFELRETMKTNLRVLFISAYEAEGVINFATIWKATATKASRVKKKKGFNAKMAVVEIEECRKNMTNNINCVSYVHVFHQLESNLKDGETYSENKSNDGIESLDLTIDISSIKFESQKGLSAVTL